MGEVNWGSTLFLGASRKLGLIHLSAYYDNAS